MKVQNRRFRGESTWAKEVRGGIQKKRENKVGQVRCDLHNRLSQGAYNKKKSEKKIDNSYMYFKRDTFNS